jgi:tetratricopeptide (TPR) repeat protein
MKHVAQDKYNIAWFTLAEYIARGEKVRALGIYRLLAHSINDTAFRCQLEGDIHLAFHDIDEAIEKYKQAAHLYQQNGKFLEAAAVYEHLCDISQNKSEYYTVMIKLYGQLRMTSKVIAYLKLLYQALLARLDIDEAEHIITQLDEIQGAYATPHEHQQMVLTLLRDELRDDVKVLHHIRSCVKGFLHSDDNRSLQKFLVMLEAIEPTFAQKAYDLAQKD